MTHHDPAMDIEALDEETIEAEHGQPARLGRKRDHTCDAVILDAALEMLAEVGFDGMTIDMVARRARRNARIR